MVSKYTLSYSELSEIAKCPLKEVASVFGDRKNKRVTSKEVKSFLQEKGFLYEAKSFALINLKGGVGKTTSAVTLASRAVQLGYKVCLLDLDAQASATLALDALPTDDDHIFHTIWQSPAEFIPNSLKEVEENFFILPSDLENSLLDVSLMSPNSQKKAVLETVKKLKECGFEIIVIDCPPSLGAAVISSICAVDEIIIPVANDAFSFKGIQLTTEEVREIRSTFGLPDLKVNILSTMVDKRLKLSSEYEEKLIEQFGEMVLKGCVRTSSDFSKSLENRETVFATAKKTNAKSDYSTIAWELFGLKTRKVVEV